MSRIEFKLRLPCLRDAIQAWLDRAQPGLRVTALIVQPALVEVTAQVEDDEPVGRTSNLHSLTVAGAGGGSALADLAASMAPGSWAQLSGATGQDATLGVGSVSGSMTYYCNSMPWNPVDKCIEIIGCDHTWPQFLRHVRYLDAGNAFVLQSQGQADNQTFDHGYDHNSVNPHTGDLYHRRYSGFTGSVGVRRKRQGGNAWETLPSVSVADQVAMGSCWWSGAFHGGGAQGQMMVFCTGAASGSPSDGDMVAFDPLTGKWFLNAGGYAPNFGSGATYHTVMEYSARKNVAVYGGGNAAPSKLWKLNANGTHAALANVPAGKAVGIGQGTFVCEPVSGNFLLFSANQLWELDPDGTGKWTQLPAPPAGLFPRPGVDGGDGVLACGIDDYGVVAWLHQGGSTGGTMYLYKHTD